MAKLSYKASYYVLYALFAIIVVVLGIFYTVGYDRMVGEYNTPEHTETLMYLIYGMLALCVVVTLAVAIIQFATGFIDSPKKAIQSLIGLVLIIVVMIVTFNMGSPEILYIPGYDGADNVPFWLQIADMFIYTIYFLLGVTVLAMLGNAIKRKLS